MNKEVKEIWIKALKSGEYKQARETMYDKETEGFCCLGVLTAEYCKEHEADFKELFNPFGYQTTLLPLPVKRWAGFNDPNKMRMLAWMNDDEKRDFKYIANYLQVSEEF